MSLFGYTSPDVLNRHEQETQSDGRNIYNGSWVKRVEKFQKTREIFGEYPNVNKTVIPN